MSASVEAAAKALWQIGNKRIGFREWETVKEHYLTEAAAALRAALPTEAPYQCPYCGCTGKESAYQRAALINGAAIRAAHLALGDPSIGVSALSRFVSDEPRAAPTEAVTEEK